MPNPTHADQLLPPVAVRRAARILACAIRASTTAVLLAAGTLIGCSSSPPAFDLAGEAYQGPRLTLEPTDAGTLVVLHAPSPGWQIRLDAVRESFGKQDVFITLREPSAVFNYPDRPVEQRLATFVATSTPVATFVRTLPFDAPRNDAAPYHPGPTSLPSTDGPVNLRTSR